MAEDPSSVPEELPPLNAARLVMSTLAVLMGVTAVAASLAFFFSETLLGVSLWFVESFGGLGVAIGFYIPDAFTVPLPNDAFSSFGLLGGLGFWEVVAWGTVGSLAGGSTGWGIGRWVIGEHPRLRRLMARRGGDKIRAQLQRHGAVFLAIAAVTPLPYSVVCWAAGASGMPFSRFFLISQLRIVRVAFYLWLVQHGFTTFAG